MVEIIPNGDVFNVGVMVCVDEKRGGSLEYRKMYLIKETYRYAN